MSAETVKEIISKAFSDREYQGLLLENPKEALKGYELTDEERKDLENLTPDIFDIELSELEDRISRGAYIN